MLKRALQACELHQKGKSKEEIAKEMSVKKCTVTCYLLRAREPEAYCEQQKRWRKKNKDRLTLYNRQYMRQYIHRPYAKQAIHERDRKEHIEQRLRVIMALGSRCQECGYNRNIAALDVHHTLSGKTVLLCANCHREAHHPTFSLKNILRKTVF